MKLTNDKDIKEAVFEMLEDILLKPKSMFSITDDFCRNLKMDSDDFSFIFVPELEEKLAIKVPVEEWTEVYTVEDAINLLKKYYNSK